MIRMLARRNRRQWGVQYSGLIQGLAAFLAFLVALSLAPSSSKLCTQPLKSLMRLVQR